MAFFFLQISSFKSVGYSILTTANMITGGVSFETIFDLQVPPSKYVPIPYHNVDFVVWIVIIVLFPIIFKNMLVSTNGSHIAII